MEDKLDEKTFLRNSSYDGIYIAMIIIGITLPLMFDVGYIFGILTLFGIVRLSNSKRPVLVFKEHYFKFKSTAPIASSKIFEYKEISSFDADDRILIFYDLQNKERLRLCASTFKKEDREEIKTYFNQNINIK